MVRYGLVGVGLAGLYAAIYFVAATLLMLSPQVANAAGFGAALIVGYLLHSRWSFRSGKVGTWSWSRFLVVNLLGYALNSFWVWLVVDGLGRQAGEAIFPIVLLTPAFTYLLNRRWTFA